jgi:hypothetical protein
VVSVQAISMVAFAVCPSLSVVQRRYLSGCSCPPSMRVSTPLGPSRPVASSIQPSKSLGDCESAAAEVTLRNLLRLRRTIRRTGSAGAAMTLTFSAITAVLSGVLATPALPEGALPAAASVLLGFVAFTEAEVGRDGVVYIKRRRRIMPVAHLDTRIAISVRLTDDGRGRGAFAAVRIPAYTSLGDYEGEMLDTAAFLTRYPTGARSEYAIAVDSMYVIDAKHVAVGTGEFTPAHMNHSRRKQLTNVNRIHWRREQRVSFFTSRDVEVGEELRFNYGKSYWTGREDQEIV